MTADQQAWTNEDAHLPPSDNADMTNRNDPTIPEQGAAAGAAAVATTAAAAQDARVRAWLHLSAQLTPLIGESGFCALFGRAVRLASVDTGGLEGCDASRPIAHLFASLTRTLNELGPEQAALANATLLETFTALLGTLIGEALTKQLLQDAMGGDGQKHEQEQK